MSFRPYLRKSRNIFTFICSNTSADIFTYEFICEALQKRHNLPCVCARARLNWTDTKREKKAAHERNEQKIVYDIPELI